MPADNTIYDQPADIWWDERQPLHALRTALNPPRMSYLRAALAGERIDPAGKVIVDVGCGGGLFAEELAALGARVIGVDPAAAAIATAREHATRAGLDIDYRIGRGERLPVADGAADVVCCVDVLEHVADLDAVIGETARVLKPGALYVFDTINRTALSRLVLIKLCQDWAATAWMPPGLHDWDQFITPAELTGTLSRHDLDVRRLSGIEPGVSAAALFRMLRRLKKGRLSPADFGRDAAFTLTSRLRVSYIGHAVKPRRPAPGRVGPVRTSVRARPRPSDLRDGLRPRRVVDIFVSSTEHAVPEG